MIASRPAEAWRPGAAPLLARSTDGPHVIGWLLTAGSVLAVVEHVVLLRKGRALRAAPQSMFSSPA